MKRCEKFVLEAQKGITFEVSDGANEKQDNKALNSESSNENFENYKNPPIPSWYKHICGEWNTGFVIERSYDGSQFVWVPVESLEPNGTLDGKHFSKKFGRRNYRHDKFAKYNGFKENVNEELRKQIKSVRKYGGFYISRYNISKDSEGRPQSVRGVKPWVNIVHDEAMRVASTIECNKTVKSHLTFGSEYDSILEWLIKTEAKTRVEIEENSTGWGNYCDTAKLLKKRVETGKRKRWCANNIYDLAGNVREWTQEYFYRSYYNNDNYCCGEQKVVMRGGDYEDSGHEHPVSYRGVGSGNVCWQPEESIGFRAALYIK